jgi:hypothetical protein
VALASVALPEVSIDRTRATGHGNRAGARARVPLDPRTDTRPAAIALAIKERDAIELRTRGFTFDQIAEKLDYKSRSAARKAVLRGLGRWLREADQDLRELELARLDELSKRLWPMVEQEDDDLALRAIEKLARVIDLRARITGMYGPRQHRVEVAATTDDHMRRAEEVVSRVQRLMELTNQFTPASTDRGATVTDADATDRHLTDESAGSAIGAEAT